MNYSDYSISEIEYFSFRDENKISPKLKDIWNDLVERITDPSLKKEAESKGFTIIDNPDMEDDVIAHYKMFQVPNGSNELEEFLVEKLYPYLVCIKED